MNNLPAVSIILSAKNEEKMISQCLKSLNKLIYPKDKLEVIIINDGSTDNTKDLILDHDWTINYNYIETHGIGLSRARNLGVKKSSFSYIIFTDADCTFTRNWIKNLMKYFNNENIASVGGPNLTPSDDTEFAKCVGKVLSFLSKPGARYGFEKDRVIETFHNPGCNVAYRKNIIAEVGWLNENLVTCEDEELDYRIIKKGYKIIYTPHAKVFHYRRPSWKGHLKQAYKYAVGRMQAIKLHVQMGKWYHLIPPFSLGIITIMIIISLFNNNLIWLLVYILGIGVIGILVMSLYLAITTKIKYLFIYFILITLWFWGSAFGSIKGLFE